MTKTQNRPLRSNPIFAENVLKRLAESPNGVIEICAADFDISCEVFGSQLDNMQYDKFILPSTKGTLDSMLNDFLIGAKTDDTNVGVAIEALMPVE